MSDTSTSDVGEFSHFYLYDDVNKLSYEASGCFGRGEQSNPPISLFTDSMQQVDDIGLRIRPTTFFEMVALDDTKFTDELYEKGVLLTRSLPGQDKDTQNSVKLALNSDDYSKLLANFDARINDDKLPVKPSWLTMMRLSRITTVTITSSDGKAQRSYDPCADTHGSSFIWLFEDL